jgi:UDP-N-acetylglucosamine acyltransferase
MGGLSAVHQFGRVGSQVMVSALTAVRDDVIPFALVNGQFGRLSGLNVVGMRRRKFSRERLAAIRSFYMKLFHGPGVFAERLNELRHLAGTDPAIAEILNFIDAGKHRELCQPEKNGKRT